MFWPPDYHMHTPLCRHAAGAPTAYAAHAVRLGFQEIGFSDHSPMLRDDFDEWRMRLDQLDEYLAQVDQARRDHPNLTIKIALEVDYLPGHEEWIRELSRRHPWDYFIGSVHYISNSWDIDNPQKLSLWNEADPDEVWTLYFERLAQAAGSGLFNILAHPDLCKKFCFYATKDCSGLYEKFLRAARETETAIEINTAGLRKECHEMYPHPAILLLAKKIGVELTFGSDAHAPEEVGMNFAEAVRLARTAGFERSCRFTQRRREFIPITC